MVIETHPARIGTCWNACTEGHPACRCSFAEPVTLFQCTSNAHAEHTFQFICDIVCHLSFSSFMDTMPMNTCQ
ncbi:hypothetical protein PAXRUDRAFT_731145 [Paxillus rubicundulus Ve08.2h10]|uniref:Uncharacterized protein n=1 Tax=Paxillus rubicundulus Ve08.2h10 TaxID=930991 RepID=A0A0D0D1V8_9AGAM|nr:hypothetical protein PAXRUDRAFT_731145 [Paxillus rubicundulus Ve08.2h10]